MARPKASQFTPSWELVAPSLALLRKQYVPALYLFILPGLLTTLGQLLLRAPLLQHGQVHLDSSQIAGLTSMFVGAVWSLVNLGPSVYFQLEATKHGGLLSLGQCYRAGLAYSLRLVGLYVVTVLAVLGGLILLIVPGFILLRRYFLAEFYLVDQNLDVRAALRASSHDSKPAAGAIWGVLGVMLAIAAAVSFLSSLSVVGLIISVVLSYVTVFLPALRYREIRR